ncbi:AMP-binding protein [Paenibacillus flagellatus]|uniref:2-acyl-glycerophospho-ethanolamine acyltransferase n=1 Tax=Paenibacillus flagellatus TaxID=2211139 RepID=A0A2V5K8R9_9BACL|nr:AMP-binding protein [Paenibacillus flagellatus]PYI55272.1 2-acyl-glycerophospho-ethanolamine acyltransferase [Paenibacillus flagellatus]
MKVMVAVLRWIVFRLFRVRLSGLGHIDATKPALLLPNHVSLLDGVFLMLALPPEVVFVVNTGIAKRFAPFLKFCRIVTVDPLNPYSVRHMIKAVQQGSPLVVFPEGRITTTGGMMKIYGGVAFIALKTGAPVHPVAINGPERSKLSYLNGLLRRRWFPPVDVTIGKAYRLESDSGLPVKVRKEQAAAQIGRMLMQELFDSRMKPDVNLFDELIAAAARNGAGFPACEDASQRIGYKQLLLASHVLGRKLAAKLEGETNVALLMPNAVGHVVALFALIRIGKTPAILNFSSGMQAVLDACETAGVRTVITSRQFVEKAKLLPLAGRLEERGAVLFLEDVRSGVTLGDKLRGMIDYRMKRRADPGANEVVLFTSGSESKPKGVVLSHRNIFANVQQARTVIDFTSRDKVFNAMPMFHSFGLTAGTLLPLLSGMKLFLYPSPLHYKAIPELVYHNNATILFGTSTFLAAYARAAHPYDFYSLRYVVAGAEKLKEDVRQLWYDKFGIRILEGYGTTETAPVLALNTPLAFRKGSVGRLLPGIECVLEKIPGIEGGNLYVRGPNVMKGYLLHGQGFVPCPDWYDCGDIVDIDADGFVTVLSRRKRFAKIAGEMVSLNAVEEWIARAFPDGEAAAVSVSDARKGERIVLFHTSPDVTVASAKEAILAAGGTPLGVPSRLARVEKLPLLGSGKTDYVALKRMAESDIGA